MSESEIEMASRAVAESMRRERGEAQDARDDDLLAMSVWAAAYGAAFAEALHRGCHGQMRTTPKGEEEIDARVHAKAWAEVCANAAVASLAVSVKPEGSEAK